jgi:hypothetical protein
LADDGLMTIAEVAHKLGLDRVAKNPRRVVREMCRKGQLHGVVVGRWLMVRPDSVARLIGSCHNAGHGD